LRWKSELDAIARTVYGWRDDGTRNTYSLDELVRQVSRDKSKLRVLEDIAEAAERVVSESTCGSGFNAWAALKHALEKANR
jgi:hypothetical protein